MHELRSLIASSLMNWLPTTTPQVLRRSTQPTSPAGNLQLEHESGSSTRASAGIDFANVATAAAQIAAEFDG